MREHEWKPDKGRCIKLIISNTTELDNEWSYKL